LFSDLKAVSSRLGLQVAQLEEEEQKAKTLRKDLEE